MKSLISCLVLLTASSLAWASERAQVCAKYQTQNGWSDGYQVQATILTGSELNQTTSSLSYQSFSTYVVIFWRPNEASVIEMSFPYLSVVGVEGEDQQGRKWEIAKTTFCL